MTVKITQLQFEKLPSKYSNKIRRIHLPCSYNVALQDLENVVCDCIVLFSYFWLARTNVAWAHCR